MKNRRDFLKTSSAVGVAVATLPLNSLLAKNRKKLNVLILGGTGFLGSHIVEAVLALGHTVTLFNRGKTNPDMFRELETIIGDRNTDAINKLANRKWDTIIDTAAYFPRSVEGVMNATKNNIKHYLFISTISVYADWSVVGMDESSPLGVIDDPTEEKITGETYGPLKVLCEKAVDKHMPHKHTIIRPGLIVGPRDKTDRFTYWPVRIHKGGEVLAPGNGNDYIQYIDVRDLAEWVAHCIQNSILGIYNAQSNASDTTIKRLLETCVKTLNPKTKLVWVPTEFLEKNDVAAWQEMPTWIPPKGDYLGSGTMSSKKAYQNGLKERPMKVIIKDCFDWFFSLSDERKMTLKAGITVEKEKKVLDAWKKIST